jgi:hypothetical protein
MGKLMRASALVLLLACSASAGIMGNDVYQPPPPPSAQSVQEPTAEDEDTTIADETETPLLVQVALDVLALL